MGSDPGDEAWSRILEKREGGFEWGGRGGGFVMVWESRLDVYRQYNQEHSLIGSFIEQQFFFSEECTWPCSSRFSPSFPPIRFFLSTVTCLFTHHFPQKHPGLEMIVGILQQRPPC